jgi:hypothetical protein
MMDKESLTDTSPFLGVLHWAQYARFYPGGSPKNRHFLQQVLNLLERYVTFFSCVLNLKLYEHEILNCPEAFKP